MLNFKKTINNLFSLSAMRLFSAAVSFALFSLVARRWGADSLGEFSTVFTYFIFLLQLPLMGLHIVIARQVAAEPETTTEQCTNALILSFFVSILLVFLVGGVGQTLYSESMHAAFWLVGVACVPMAFTAVVEAVLIGQERMAVIAKVNIVENILRVAICIILVLLGFGITALFGAFLLARAVAVGIYWFHGGIGKIVNFNSATLYGIVDYIKQSPTFFGILLLSLVSSRFDFIFLSILGSMHDVGMYSPSFKVYEMVLMIPNVMTIVLFPVFSKFYNESREKFVKLYQIMFRVIWIVGVPVVVSMIVLSGVLIPLIFGQEYTDSAGVLQILSFAVLLIALDQLLTAVMLAGHREDLDLRVLMVSAIVFVVLLSMFIPIMGYYGAAIATLVTTCVKLLLRYYWVQKEMDMHDAVPVLYKPATAGILMGGAAYLLMSVNIVYAVLASWAVYIFLLLAIKGISKKEIRAFKEMMVAQSGSV